MSERELATAVPVLDALRGQPVIVLGDVMLDRYWWGSVQRLSPEAPVPVVHKQRASVAPGGAANVAANVASLGGVPRLLGVTGADEAGRELRAELERRGIDHAHVLVDPSRPTTVKTRVVAHSQHVVRVDEEDRRPLSAALAARLVEALTALLDEARVLIVSDYAKGLLGPELLRRAIHVARARECWVVVDPKGSDYSRYRGASLICPNRMEALAAVGVDSDAPDAVSTAGTRLLEAGVAQAVLITLGEAGMMLFEPTRAPRRIPALARAVFDVTGAGDTVIATAALALAAGAPLDAALRLANFAAGLAVEQVGTAAVTTTQLRDALESHRDATTTPVG
jgi:D-beta-D-heptose 7-phosphate kinase/D-beta-D-heptose 1-phosphate adenosyltransferase